MGEKRKILPTGSLPQTNSPKRPKPSMFASSSDNVPGIIKRVHLKDFMVHSDFSWEPCYNVNFVTGSNGSGKSSLLQGIVIGLMSDARHTKRYKKLTDFIKRGASKAVIKVSILNTGENPYNFEKYGPLITFCRTLHASGSSLMQLLDHKNNIVNGSSKTAKEEGKRILQHFDIQIDNPLTVLQQDHAKEMLRVEKPEKLFAFFESATLIKQAREQYQNAHTEISQLKVDIASKREVVEELKIEANKYIEKYNKATRHATKDQEIAALQKEKSWARVVKAKEILNKRLQEQKIVNDKIDESKEKIKKLLEEIEGLRKQELELKVSMDETVAEEFGVREQYEIKKETIRKKEVEKSKVDKDIKNLFERKEVFVSETIILEEMLKRFNNNPLDVKALETKIRELKAEDRAFDINKDKLELEREKVEMDVFTNGTEIKQKCFEILAQKTCLQQKIKEQQEIIELQTSRDELAVYHGASQVEKVIRANQSLFRYLPMGPVGRFLRVKTSDSNLINLIETELGNKTLASYLCDNDQDRKKLVNILNQVYGGGRGKPMIFTSKFLKQKHNVFKPGGLSTVLDLTELVGTEEEKTVVFNFLVDVRQVEAVVVVETQAKAKELTTFARNVPRGLGYCITLDWYKFIPPSHSGSYRSYYLEKRNGLGLLNTSTKGKLQEKKEEVSQVKVELTELESKKIKLQSTKKDLEDKSKNIMVEVEKIRKHLLEVGTKVRREKALLEDICEPDNIKNQIQLKNNEVKQLEMNVRSKKAEFESIKSDILKGREECEFMGEEIAAINTKLAPVTTMLNQIEAKINSIDKIKRNQDSRCQKMLTEKFKSASESKKLEKQLVLIEVEAKRLTNNVVLTPSSSLELLQAKINQMTKEKLSREQQDDCTALRLKYDDLLAKYELKKRKLKSLKELCDELEVMEGRRLKIFLGIKKHTINMVERRFSQLAEEAKMANNIMLNVDYREREITFMFGSGKSSKGDLSTLSGGEKSYAQLCLILSLWHFMFTPFRCLDEWDVFLDAINRKAISLELLNFATKREGEFQFIFISPQGALDVPNKKSVKIFEMGSE